MATRPSPIAVANYLDRLAVGDDPLQALPTLGAFADSVAPGVRIDSSRISDNLALAARRTSDELLRTSAYADLRKRAETRFAPTPRYRRRRAPARSPTKSWRSCSPEAPNSSPPCSSTKPARSSSRDPRDCLRRSARRCTTSGSGCSPGSQAEALPWGTYERRADQLRGADQRDAALELCELDDAQQKTVFTPKTRRQLERLILRNRSLNASKPSCPEAALVRAAEHLGGMIQRVQVINPPKPSDSNINTPTGAGRALTLACARLRLGALLRAWDATGGEVDGLLLRSARGDDPDDLGDVLAAFGDAGLGNRGRSCRPCSCASTTRTTTPSRSTGAPT